MTKQVLILSYNAGPLTFFNLDRELFILKFLYGNEKMVTHRLTYTKTFPLTKERPGMRPVFKIFIFNRSYYTNMFKINSA